MEKIIALLLAIGIASSCCICKNLPTHDEVNVRDSVVVHIKDSIRIIDKVNTRDSVVLVPLPVESSQSVLPAAQSSHLETSLAESDAVVDSAGFLHHSIRNKDGALEAHVPVTEHQHYEEHYHQADSTAMHSDSETQTVTEYVDRPLTWWQQFRIEAFWWLLLALVLTNIKTIIKLIKKIVL